MSAIEQIIQVTYRHQVHFSDDIFNPDNLCLRNILCENGARRAARVLMVMDESLSNARPALADRIDEYFARCSPDLTLVCPPVIIEGGERAKNSYFHVSEIQSQVDRYHIDRHSYIVAIGGGALLDVVGLAAGTAHRGVRLVRVPTTTLAQADSGVGVKNGINSFGKKNFIGTFSPPFAVINDFTLLESLQPRDKRAGFIEGMKVALIRDRAFFESIEHDADALASFDGDSMRRLIRRAAELHVRHIGTSGDPFEFGSARPLDFGHWAAHKLEQISNFKISHGEAVAIGICLDVIYSRKIGLLDTRSCERILKLVARLGFEVFANELLNVDSQSELMVLRGLEEFREHLGGELTVTLLESIGSGVEVHSINLPLVVEAIYELQQLHQAGARKIIVARA